MSNESNTGSAWPGPERDIEDEMWSAYLAFDEETRTAIVRTVRCFTAGDEEDMVGVLLDSYEPGQTAAEWIEHAHLHTMRSRYPSSCPMCPGNA